MNRRLFLQSSFGAATWCGLGWPRLAADPAEKRFPLLDQLVRANDERVDSLLPQQQRRTGHPAVGSLSDAHGIPTVHATAHFVTTLGCAIAAAASLHHRSSGLIEPLESAARYLLSAQHADGTIDLISTNFHSPPDTAFVVESLAPLVVILRNEGWRPLERLQMDLERFLRRAGTALATGGLHTPNHRWVVCAALARIHSLYPEERYVTRIEQWLAEGIDLDPDGQYTEKSTTVYSPVVNRALLTVARLLDRPQLREPVRRNLEMTLYYVHPDGEVVTEASRRQDRYQRGSMGRYYYSYRTLALLERNGRFAAMARQIERTALPQLTGELAAFLEEPELQRELPPDEPLPTDYVKTFAHSHLARIRRGNVSATVLARNSTLFSLRRGAAALEAVRVASAFFGKGQFVAGELEVLPGGYRLRQHLEGPYFQPLTADQIVPGEPVSIAPNGTLAIDGRALRARSNVQTLESTIEVAEGNGGFALHLDITGTDGVPVAVELGFRRGGSLAGVEAVPGVPDAFLLTDGHGRYRSGGDTIQFGPGRADHTWTQLRGALPKWDGLSVYLTGLTPFRLTLNLT